MIDFKNYERVTNTDDKQDRFCFYDCCVASCDECVVEQMKDRLTKLEDLIEQGKLVEKSVPKTTLTNREYLKTLSNEEFARTIATKIATTQEPNFNGELKYTEIVNDIQIELENWINEEFKE